MWLDDCRIPFVDEGEDTSRKQTPISVEVYGWSKHKGLIGSFDDSAKQGRFTPNLLVCDDMLNDGSVSKSQQKEKNITKKHNYNINFGVGEKYSEINDKGTNSRYYDLDLWFDKMVEKL